MIWRGVAADDFDCGERLLLRQRERAAMDFQRARRGKEVHCNFILQLQTAASTATNSSSFKMADMAEKIAVREPQ